MSLPIAQLSSLHLKDKIRTYNFDLKRSNSFIAALKFSMINMFQVYATVRKKSRLFKYYDNAVEQVQ